MTTDLAAWIGKSEEMFDVIAPRPIQGLAALLDQQLPEDISGFSLPPLWHWVYFVGRAPQSTLTDDGHPPRGGFLPPVPLPRRMWAGGRLNWLRPIHEGQTIKRISTITDVTLKKGKSGDLYFVKVRHEVSGADGLAIEEDQDLVYRDFQRAGAPPEQASASAPAAADWRIRVQPTTTLLFRYSALTFNAHRIHYDRSYATGVEGYPGLVVHGPLLATLLIGYALKEVGEVIRSFSFRAISPVFDLAPFDVCGSLVGGQATLWIEGVDGQRKMEALATFRAAD